ncbi:MAG: hypothetical protein K1X89_03655 [Myxococcaceae bacterium]|nr:hypothetical protein [Myxococcaceae bacterium]
MRALPLAVATLTLLGCSKSEYQGHGVRWTPPRGSSFERESGQDVEFSKGVRLRFIDALGAADGAHLAAIRAALAPEPETIISATPGTVPAGPVVRVLSNAGGARALRYYVPMKQGAVVVELRSSSGSATDENQLDLSMASLRFD